MHAWIRDKVVVGAVGGLLLCVGAGIVAERDPYSAHVEPTPGMLLAAKAPPIEIEPPPQADWDLPQEVPAPADPVQSTRAELARLADEASTPESSDPEDTDLALSNSTLTIARPDMKQLANNIQRELKQRRLAQQAIQGTPAAAPQTVSLQVPAAETIKEAQVNVAGVSAETFFLLDTEVQPGQLVRTNWTAGEALHGAQIPTPVLIAHGTKTGPTLCLTAAVHGDELNGIESVRRIMHAIKPGKLTGTVIGVPIVNLQGFQRHSRYLADRRDLNRFFPGNPRGSSASRMAYSFFENIIRRCDGLVDLHTGSFHRTNLPQLRADLTTESVMNLTQGFGSTVILHSFGGQGTLRRAAVDAGIPAVTLEAGEPLRLQEDAVEHTVKAVFTLLDTLDMYNKRSLWGNAQPTYYASSWVRADQGGILLSSVKLGRKVKEGDLLGTVTDPITNESSQIVAPYSGRVIGMALNQFVMPGYATFHVATTTSLEELPIDDNSDLHSQGGMNIAAAEEGMGSNESE